MNSTIKQITDRLSAAYEYDEALALAYWIVEEKANLTRSELILRQEQITIEGLDRLIERLLQHEPIQYIFGHTNWLGLDISVTPDTLIPRPETAELIGLLPYTTRPLRVLDIGTGSGCIAIATKRARPTWQVEAVDISEKALEVARTNAEQNNVDITFRKLDILTTKPGMYDIVLSNPPYIREKEKSTMNSNVLAHEPHTALFVPDDDPLLFYRAIAEKHIAPSLFFEINEALAKETVAMLKSEGYTDIEIHQDIYGKDRFITAATTC